MPRDPRGSADDQTEKHQRGDDGPSDGELIAAVRAGDIRAFEFLVRRYRQRLLLTAHARLGDMALAEDVVQDAFLAAFRSLSTYDSRWSFRSWLWSILINQCRNAYRKKKRNETKSTLAAEPAITNDTRPELPLIRREELETVSQLMRRLPPAQADAIQLRFFGEMKYDEIAEAMQCGLTTAKNRVRVGLQTLSQWMQSSRFDE